MQNIDLETAEERPSILQLMVENPEGVKDTIDLLKEEVAVQVKQVAPQPASVETSRQLSNLSNLLNDTRVRQMVNEVAGEKVVSIIDNTLGTIDSGCSAEIKRQAFTNGIQKIQSNLKNLETLRENQSFNFAASLIGLDGSKLKSLQNGSSSKIGY